jgi:hypothetical protein
MNLYLKVHRDQKGRIVAACDSGLIGKILQDNKAYMDLDKHRDFFMGEEVDEKRLEEELDEFASVNLVGEHSVGVALRIKLVGKKDVMYINSIPYIQIYRI